MNATGAGPEGLETTEHLPRLALYAPSIAAGVVSVALVLKAAVEQHRSWNANTTEMQHLAGSFALGAVLGTAGAFVADAVLSRIGD